MYCICLSEKNIFFTSKELQLHRFKKIQNNFVPQISIKILKYLFQKNLKPTKMGPIWFWLIPNLLQITAANQEADLCVDPKLWFRQIKDNISFKCENKLNDSSSCTVHCPQKWTPTIKTVTCSCYRPK